MSAHAAAPGRGHAAAEWRVAALANSLYDALVAADRPPRPPRVPALAPGDMGRLVSYALRNPAWQRDAPTVMRLVSAALVPTAWPEPGLPALRAAAGDAARSGVCGRVWKEDELAYKCKTCERDPTCVVCVPCFRRGNHEGHDYAMVRTAGGCCDCGDVQAWRPQGFCSIHSGASPEHHDPSAAMPPALRRNLSEAVHAVAAAILSLTAAMHLDHTLSPHTTGLYTARVAAMLDWITDVVKCGDGMRRAVALVLISTDSQRWLIDALEQVHVLDKMALTRAELTAGNLSWLSLMLRIDGVERLPLNVQVSLHAVYFQLITDLVFKRTFLERFVENYERFVHAQVAQRNKNDESDFLERGDRTSGNIVENFTVQLFTVPALIPVMIRPGGLLDVLLKLLQSLLETFAAPVHCYENSIPLAESAYAQKYPSPRASLSRKSSAHSSSSPASPSSTARRRRGLPISSLLKESALLDSLSTPMSPARVVRASRVGEAGPSDAVGGAVSWHQQRHAEEGMASPVGETESNRVATPMSDDNMRPNAHSGAQQSTHEQEEGSTSADASADLAHGSDDIEVIGSEDEAEFMSEDEAERLGDADNVGNVAEAMAAEGNLVDVMREVLEQAAEDGEIDEDEILTAEVVHIETIGHESNYIDLVEEGDGPGGRGYLQQLAAFEESLSFEPPEQLRLAPKDTPPSRFRSSIAEARSMAKAAATGEGLIAHPMRLDWSRHQQLSMDVVYWRLLVDLRYVLCHPAVSFHLIHQREDLFRVLVRIISMAQGMNPSSRRFGDHVAMEGETWAESFKLEIEIYHIVELLSVAFCMDKAPGAENTMDCEEQSTARNADTRECRLRCISIVRTCLDEWLDREEALEALSTYAGESFSVIHSVSVHLPLHRFLALLVHHVVRLDNVELAVAFGGGNLMTRPKDAARLLIHPLKVQVFLAQVRAGMWRRNGRPVVGQSMYYRFVPCSEWFVDLDLFIQQCCAVLLGPQAFLHHVRDAFRIKDVGKLVALSYFSRDDDEEEDREDNDNRGPRQRGDQLVPSAHAEQHKERRDSRTLKPGDDMAMLAFLPLAPEHLRRGGSFRRSCIPEMGNSASELAKFAPVIVEELMMYLVRVTSERSRCGQDEAQLLRRKLVHQLCSRDRTHSQLYRACSYRICNDLGRHTDASSDLNQDVGQGLVESTLASIANYTPPKGMEQGKYSLKDEVWEEFDQFSPHLSPRDRCAAEVRHSAVCKKQKAPVIVVPKDNVNDRVVYRQFSGLQNLIVSLSGTDANGIVTEVLMENMRRNKGSQSVETTLSAALHVICAAAEALPNGSTSPEVARWYHESSIQEQFSSTALGVVCDLIRRASGSNDALHTELRPTAERILRRAYREGGADLKNLLRLETPGTFPSSQSPGDDHSTGQGLSPDEERKRILRKKKKEQQEAAMARMRQAQASFARHISLTDEGKESELSPKKKDVESLGSPGQPVNTELTNHRLEGMPGDGLSNVRRDHAEASHAADHHEEECALCHEDGSSDGTRLIGLIGFHQVTRLPSVARGRYANADRVLVMDVSGTTSKEEEVMEDITVESELRTQRSTATSQKVQGSTSSREATRDRQAFYLDSKVLEGGIEDGKNLHMSFCGHAIHITCFEGYFSSLLQSRANQTLYEGYYVLDLERVEFLCPVCRRLANMVLPLMHNMHKGDTIAAATTDAHRSTSLSFADWLQRSDLEIRHGWSREVSTSQVRSSLSVHSHLRTQTFTNEPAREIVNSVNALGASIINRARAVLQRFGLQGPQNGHTRDENRDHDVDTERTRSSSCSKLPSAALSTTACAEIAARSVPWNASLFQSSRRSLRHVLREARAQIRLDPTSRTQALRVLWKWATDESGLNPPDPFCCVSFLFLLWAEPFTVREAKKLVHLGLTVLKRIIQKETRKGILDNQEEIVELLLYLRRTAVLLSAYFNTGSAVPLATYQSQKVACNVNDSAEEIYALGDYLEIPRGELNVWLERRCAASTNEQAAHLLRPPRVGLIKLPTLFQSLLEELEGEVCVECKEIPKTPALCLVCGSLICNGVGSNPGSSPSPLPCKQGMLHAHAQDCGAGVGLFLLLKLTRIMIIRNDRSTRWGSPYLDLHGEEDQTLSRGKPLFLNEERYSVLEQLWLFHGFDQDSRVLSFTQPIRRMAAIM